MTALRQLGEEEGVAWVLRILEGGKRMDTREIEEATKSAGFACPDSTARFLSGLRSRGVIAGELVIARKTWVWWKP